MATMTSVVAMVRQAVGPRAVRIADTVAGLGMLGFAAALGYRTARDA
jgi:hypothetical protein